MQRDVVVFEEVGLDDRQIRRALAREERSESDAIVRGSRLFAEHRDVEVFRFASHVLQQALAYHSITDDEQFLAGHVDTHGVTTSAPLGGASLSARALSASSYRRRSSSCCSRVNLTASAHTAVAATIAPSRNSAY